MRGRLICGICPQDCRLEEGQTGICHARRNMDGRIVPLAYGKPCAIAVDPMEKKPLFHFRPGTRILSLGMAGCNLRRRGFDVIDNGVRDGDCPRCGGKIYGRF